MKKGIFIILLVILSKPLIKAQKIQYGGMQQFGLVYTEKGLNTSFHFMNGIRFYRFFTGIGASTQFPRSNDYFYYSNFSYNTLSLYTDVRYYFNKKKSFFALAEGGVNYISDKINDNDYNKYKKHPGYYAAGGIGFKAKLGNEVFYTFDLSYSIKQSKYDHSYKNFLNEWQTDKNEFKQVAIMLRLGIEIF